MVVTLLAVTCKVMVGRVLKEMIMLEKTTAEVKAAVFALICCFLSFALVVAGMPVTANAEDDEEIILAEENDAIEQSDVLLEDSLAEGLENEGSEEEDPELEVLLDSDTTTPVVELEDEIFANPPTNTSATSKGDEAVPRLSYQSHVQRIGWQNKVTGPRSAGTTGRGLRMEAIRFYAPKTNVPGGITYAAHVQGIG